MGQGDGMEVVCIGAGNVATHLCLALQQAGHHVAQVYSRTEESAAALGRRLGCAWTVSLQEVTAGGELYVLCVRDQVLADVAQRLYASLQRRAVPGRTDTGARALFVHTAGSMPMDVLPMLRRGVFYPMQTFSRQREVSFRGMPVFVESLSDLALLRRLAADLGAEAHEMDSRRRKYLHVAAVLACNFTNHLYDLCADLLARHDIPLEVMLPLIDETARKVHDLSPREAQTGPAVRHDEAVMGRHMDLLPDERTRRIYALMSESIYEYAKRGGEKKEKHHD